MLTQVHNGGDAEAWCELVEHPDNDSQVELRSQQGSSVESGQSCTARCVLFKSTTVSAEEGDSELPSNKQVPSVVFEAARPDEAVAASESSYFCGLSAVGSHACFAHSEALSTLSPNIVEELPFANSTVDMSFNVPQVLLDRLGVTDARLFNLSQPLDTEAACDATCLVAKPGVSEDATMPFTARCGCS